MDNENSKVSIIIAIYQVSKYLRQCLNSVINQTYKNIEIICVVGNTDEASMNIVSSFARSDSRIKFIPVKPEGVSAARNAGLNEVSGEYIAFIDGDDYVDTDMIETMVDAAASTSSDIAIVGKYYLYENTVEGIYRDGKMVYDRRGVMQEILKNESFFLHLWDKLYKRDLFTGITFPVGAIVEDRQICFKLLLKANKYVFIPKSKYYFRQCIDSSSKLFKNKADSIAEDFVICEKIKELYPELTNDVELFLVIENMSLLQSSFLYDVYSREHDKETIEYIRKHMKTAMRNPRCSKGLKAKMFLSAYFTDQFKQITIKRRADFLETHKHFKSGNDWEKLFKQQGIEMD